MEAIAGSGIQGRCNAVDIAKGRSLIPVHMGLAEDSPREKLITSFSVRFLADLANRISISADPIQSRVNFRYYAWAYGYFTDAEIIELNGDDPKARQTAKLVWEEINKL